MTEITVVIPDALIPTGETYTYLRPGGVDSYLRPNGTDTYERP